jgi:hypothetical protein
MEPWYKVATPRVEVREGRSFHPDEFAIALEQVVRGTAPEDYSDPAKFFSRTYFTQALLWAERQCGLDFLRLANALSALYPRESGEKRLLDAMLLTVPRWNGTLPRKVKS